jgi:nucleoside recognition membrane protein YjiH
MHFLSEFFHIFTTTVGWRLMSFQHAFSWITFANMGDTTGNRQGRGPVIFVSSVASCQ